MESPLPQREVERLEVHRRYPTLESLPADSFASVLALCRRQFGSTVAVVYIPLLRRAFTDAAIEVDRSLLVDLCGRIGFDGGRARIVIHPDLDRREPFRHHALVTSAPGFRFFAGVPLRSPDGIFVGFLGLFDTAARSFSNADCDALLGLGETATSELELRRVATDASRLIDDHPHPIWEFEVSTGEVFRANDAAVRFYGRERERLVGMHVRDLLVADDARAALDRQNAGSGLERLSDTGHVMGDGTVRRVQTILSTGYRGERRTCAVEVRTTAEQHQLREESRQAETFYRKLLDELPIELAVLDTEGRILFANDAAVHEPDLRAWIIGKTWPEYFSAAGLPETVAEQRMYHVRQAGSERRRIDFEESVRDLGTEPRGRRCTIAPILRSDGSIRYLIFGAVELAVGGKAPQAPSEQEVRFRSIARSLPLGMALLESGGRLIEYNAAFLKITGSQAEELDREDRPLHRLAHPDDAQVLRALIEDVATGTTESGQRECRFIRKDGSIVWTDVTLALVRDAQRQAGPLLLILEDVTERRELEQDLRKSERRYGSLLEQAPDAMIVSRLRGPVLEANARTCELTGYTREELLRLPLNAILRNGDLEPQDEVWDALMRGETVEAKRNLAHRDGSYTVVAVRMRLVDDRYVLVVARDVAVPTERIDLTGFQSSALAQMSDAVVATDVLGVITYVNPAAERLLGIDAGDVVGRHTGDVIRARLIGDQRIGEIAEILFRDGQWRGELSVDLADNRRIYTDVSVRLARDRDGHPIGTLAVARDVTDRKEREHSLVIAKEEAEELNRLKTAFLANMSHEIRTPLTSIIGFAEVLSEEAAENEREFAGLIRNSGRRLMETLNSVLDLAQLESDALRLDPVEIDVMETVREALELFRAQAAEKGVYLEAESDHPGPIHARLDRAGLSRILINLISNAIKFTHEGGIRVHVRTDGDHIHFSVKDTGVGISREFLPHLFDEFKQESSGLARQYEGSGLGLTITKRLVELMDGAIDVESEKGKGTVFIVTFPL